MVRMTEAQILLQKHLEELGIKTVAEYRFDSERNWRFDLADLEHRLAFELDGGIFQGGHTRGAALEKDYEKQNVAQLSGWRILRFTNRQAMKGEAKQFLAKYLCRR